MYIMDAMIGIYKIINPKNKVYIGQSVDIDERKKQYKYLSKNSLGRKILNSLKKYGWENHTFDVIEECKVEELDDKEIFYGGKYNSLGKEGLNLKLGAGRGLCSDETKKLMSIKASASMTPERRDVLSKAKLGKKHSEAHNISKCVPKKSKENFKNNGKWVSLKRAVNQYDLDGNFIQRYDLIRDAEIKYHPKKLKKTNICNCCRGNQNTAYGFIWKYEAQQKT